MTGGLTDRFCRRFFTAFLQGAFCLRGGGRMPERACGRRRGLGCIFSRKDGHSGAKRGKRILSPEPRDSPADRRRRSSLGKSHVRPVTEKGRREKGGDVFARFFRERTMGRQSGLEGMGGAASPHFFRSCLQTGLRPGAREERRACLSQAMKRRFPRRKARMAGRCRGIIFSAFFYNSIILCG